MIAAAALLMLEGGAVVARVAGVDNVDSVYVGTTVVDVRLEIDVLVDFVYELALLVVLYTDDVGVTVWYEDVLVMEEEDDDDDDGVAVV
jgi:hypothetical protein